MAALDPMDFLMHQGENGTSQAPGSGFHGLPQHQGCPYFRSQQHHGSSLPPLNLDAGFYPMPHHTGHASGHHSGPQHPQHPQQQQQQQTHSHSQSQTQPQPQPPTQSHSHSHSHSHPHPQSQPSQQLPPLQPPTLPYPQPYPHSHHSPYDPVHPSGAVWYSSAPPSVWSSAALHPYPIPPSHSRPSGADSHFGGPGSGSGSGSGSGAGIVQPQQQFLPRPDHYSPWSFDGYHRSNVYPHPSIVLPMPPPLSNHNHTSRQGQSDQTQPHQPNRSSRPATSHTPPAPMSNERGAPPPPARGLTLPSLNPNASQNPAGVQTTPPAMSSSRESDSREPSPPAQPALLLNRPSAFRFPDDSARPSNRGNGEGPPLAPTHAPQLPLPSDYPGMEYPRADGFMADRGNLPHSSGHPPPNLTPPSLSSRRQQLLARRLGQPDHDSDEELGSSADEEEQMLRYIDEFGVNPTHFRSLVAEDHIRAAQVLRGQLPNKRVASKKALGQLQSVDLDSLSESERTCVICYNDFGQASPEGVIEAPLRLPKCQHVFGDHCIKKWFEESDSCPYCRDKVPSEVALAPGLRTYQNLFRMRSRMPAGSASLTPNDDSILRILAHQDAREAARLRARPEAGSDNPTPRPFQPRERRSPPSEAMENRRRTRARHSSFHPSYPAGFAVGRASTSSHTAGAPGPGQQSPSRERSMTTGQRLFYTPTDQGHASSSASQHDQSTPTPAVFRLGPSPPMQMTPHNPYYPSMPYGAPPAPYPQQQPALGSLTPPHFQNPTSSGNNAGPDNAGSEGQLQ